MKLRITRYYVGPSDQRLDIAIGPFFSRKRAERCARNCGPCALDPAMRAIGSWAVVHTARERQRLGKGTYRG